MNKYVVAVSGGVDSVVLIDILARQSNLELIVAHFDHGIREDSADDVTFVADLAKKYGLLFETRREELGQHSSENLARARRYEFLRMVAKKHNAKLVTAHHADDAIETIAINLTRGTGWRGLAAMDSDVARPLKNVTKSEVLNYAKHHNLKWHEDSTNATDNYLRNRIRRNTLAIDNDIKRQLLGLWSEQKMLKRRIDDEVAKLIGSGPTYSRYFFIHLDDKTGLECLRRVTEARLTRPQLLNLLYKIKTTLPNKMYQAGDGIRISFSARNFTVELIK